MGVGIFLYWFIFVLKYQGKMINLQIRIILTYVQFIPSEQKQKSSIPIYHCNDVIIEVSEFLFLQQMEQPGSCAICCIK